MSEPGATCSQHFTNGTFKGVLFIAASQETRTGKVPLQIMPASADVTNPSTTERATAKVWAPLYGHCSIRVRALPVSIQMFWDTKLVPILHKELWFGKGEGSHLSSTSVHLNWITWISVNDRPGLQWKQGFHQNEFFRKNCPLFLKIVDVFFKKQTTWNISFQPKMFVPSRTFFLKKSQKMSTKMFLRFSVVLTTVFQEEKEPFSNQLY